MSHNHNPLFRLLAQTILKRGLPSSTERYSATNVTEQNSPWRVKQLTSRPAMRKPLKLSAGITLSVMLTGMIGHAQAKIPVASRPAPIAQVQQTPPSVVRVEPTPQEVQAVANQIATDRALWGREPEFWLVIFSGLLFFGTMGLWWATWKAADAAAKASDLTLELERPYVYVRYRESGLEEREIEKTTANGDTEIMEVARYKGPLEFLFVNFGRSPAILTEIFDDYLWLDGVHDTPPLLNPATKVATKQAHGTVTANGDPFGIGKTPRSAFSKGKRLKTNTFKVDSFFLQGFVRYNDVRGNRYLLVYCAKFDRDSAKFVAVNNDRYNYTLMEGRTSLFGKLGSSGVAP